MLVQSFLTLSLAVLISCPQEMCWYKSDVKPNSLIHPWKRCKTSHCIHLSFLVPELLCPELAHPAGTRVTDYSREFGTVVTYTCKFGHKFFDKSSVRTTECSVTGAWSNPIGVCEGKITYCCSFCKIEMKEIIL